MLTVPATPWTALLPAALAGTRRQPFAPLPGLSPALGAETDAPDKQLLLTAATLALVQRAGQRPQSGPATLPALPPETWPALPEAAVWELEELLAEPVDASGGMGDSPYTCVLRAAMQDLRQLGRRLPARTVLRVLRSGRGRNTDATTARQVLGERGRWLNALVGEATYWYLYALSLDWTTLPPTERYAHLARQMQRPMRPGESYLPQLAELPRQQRTQLLWETWRADCGWALPPPLQAELDALLAATPPAKRPWTTTLRDVQWRAGHPRLAGHPLLARLAEWTAPLLWLEQLLGSPPRVRVELPPARDPAWDLAGLRHSFIHSSRGSEPEFCLQELLYALGPRYWAQAWQRPPAEVVALVAAAPRGRLVLEAWAQALGFPIWPEPDFARALLALPRRLLAPERRPPLLRHLPLAEQLAWFTALLPADLAAPHEPEWVQMLNQWELPLDEPPLLRPLLPVLAAALAQPRTKANARQCTGLQDLLYGLHMRDIEARLYPEVRAALGGVVPAQPQNAKPLGHLLRGLALRYELRQACGGSVDPPPAS